MRPEAVRPDPVAVPVRRGGVMAYLRLGKVRIYHHAYGWVIAVALLHHEDRLRVADLPALLLLLIMVEAVQFAGGAADDLGGYRDGSDARNYAGRPARTVAKKPLLTGALDESQAVRFAVVCWVVGVSAGLLAALLVAGRASPWAVVWMLAAQIASVQYSTGARLSYRPLGLELTIFFVTGTIALMPYWLIAGQPTRAAALAAALFGVWFLMIVSYGNASDRVGDAEVNRHTLAVLLPQRAFAVVLAALLLIDVTLIGALFTTTTLSPVAAWTLVPVVVLHGCQLYFGPVRGNWRTARFIGLASLDAGALGLVAAILLSAR